MAKRDRRHAYVVFQISGQRYAVDAQYVEQIVAMAEMDCPPNAPKLLAGFLNVEGRPIPVIRVSRLIQQSESPLELWTPLVVVRFAKQRMALIVDSVEQVVAVDDAALSPLPPGHALNDCVEGILRTPDVSVLVVSAERLLLQQELRTVDELRRMAQQRIHELAGADA
jgi:purine-binding chemotaxis protein CheW